MYPVFIRIRVIVEKIEKRKRTINKQINKTNKEKLRRKREKN